MYKKLFVLFIALILLISLIGLFLYNQKKLNKENTNNITEEITQEETEEFDEGIMGRLIIKKIDLNGKIKEGSSQEVLKDYIGHIEDTAKYDGNVRISGT